MFGTRDTQLVDNVYTRIRDNTNNDIYQFTDNTKIFQAINKLIHARILIQTTGLKDKELLKNGRNLMAGGDTLYVFSGLTYMEKKRYFQNSRSSIPVNGI